MSDRFAIAQVSPFPWEDEHEVNVFVRALSAELAGRGHRMLVLAPSRSPKLVRESRKLIRAARGNPDSLFDEEGGVRVLGVGELLPTVSPRRRGVAPSPPIDISRTIEEVLTIAKLDFVHVHEPFAPGATSVALRHSRALNVGSFHSTSERPLSTQVARRFVELFFGRLDARTAAFETTSAMLQRFFPAEYQVVMPGAPPARPREDSTTTPTRIIFFDQEERAALRLFVRSLRRLPDAPAWEAVVVAASDSAPIPVLNSRLRERVQLVAVDQFEGAAAGDLVVCGSAGTNPAPEVVLQGIAAGAIPVVPRIPAYQEIVGESELGLAFDPAQPAALASQLERLLGEDNALRAKLRGAGADLREHLSWKRVATEFEDIYAKVAKRRHPLPGPLPEKLAQRPLIDVDLHMHTDHSWDCATPVDVLLATAKEQGLGAIAVTDHNEVSGALDAAEKASEYGVKVIVAEEVKTADQGEVIGLFIKEKIPRGMTLDETIAAIREQGGLVYVPHPFDRLHSVPDYEHLLDIIEEIDLIEIFNPRVAITAFNEEAVRFAAKYRITAAAGSDSHVAQGLGSVRIRMRDFDGPEEFLASLKDADIIRKPSSLLYVQALKFLQTKATPSGAKKAVRARKVAKAVASKQG